MGPLPFKRPSYVSAALLCNPKLIMTDSRAMVLPGRRTIPVEISISPFSNPYPHLGRENNTMSLELVFSTGIEGADSASVDSPAMPGGLGFEAEMQRPLNRQESPL
jgi:hypothetical protein